MSDAVIIAIAMLGLLCYVGNVAHREFNERPISRKRLLYVDVLLVVAAAEVVADAFVHAGFTDLAHAISTTLQGAFITGGIVLFLTRHNGDA